MQVYEVPVILERTPEGVIASCDELNAVASEATEEEALRNLEEAINALVETYSAVLPFASRSRSEEKSSNDIKEVR